MNSEQVDFEITSRRGNTIALIEVKNIPNLTLSLAADLRQGLLENETIPSLPAFLLIVSQEKAFLWEPEQSGTRDAEPAAVFSMRQVLLKYLPESDLDRHIPGAALEIAVFQWLSDMTMGHGTIPMELNRIGKFAELLCDADIQWGAVL